MNTDSKVNEIIAEWLWGHETDVRVLAYISDARPSCIMVFPHDDPKDNKAFEVQWFTESVRSWLDYVFPTLERKGYEPEIKYDIDIHQWSICLRSTTSNCSIDSPVEYCNTEDIAFTLCGLTLQVIRQGVKA